MLTYYIVYSFSCVIGWLPYKVQFIISDIVRWVLHRVVRYRVRVVRQNLSDSFPEWSRAELMEVENNFYKHLADVFLETISMASVSRKAICKRMDFTNVDHIETLTEGRSWISAMAHYGSWEYTVNYALLTRHDEVLAVYRPLASKSFDKYYRKTRSRFGVTPVPMKEVTREIFRRQASGNAVAIAMIADQTPPWPSIQNWTMFLGRETPFFMGMEKIALKFGLPVAFLHVDKVSRGYYKAWFEIIYDGTEEVPEHEITRRYAAKLEEMIRRRPELWMWSHRRWKHKKKDVA